MAQWYSDGMGLVTDEPQRLQIFLFPEASKRGSGTPGASYSVGARGSFLRSEAVRREDDHSPPSSFEDRNSWSYTSFPPYAFMAICLIK